MSAKETTKSGIKHECELDEKEGNEFTIADVLTRGQCAAIKRCIVSQIIIWRNNARSIRTYKSDFVIKQENVQYLLNGSCLIHPFSRLRFWWEIFMVVQLTLLFLEPITDPFHNLWLGYLKLGTFICQSIDILLNFNTGYQILSTSQVIMSRRKITMNYLRTTFILHALACIGDLFATELIPVKGSQYIAFLVLFRLETFFRYIHNIEAYHDSYTNRRRIVELFFITLIAFLWVFKLSILNEDEGFSLLVLFKEVWHGLFFQGYAAINLDLNTIRDDMIACIVGFCLKLICMAYCIRLFRKYYYQEFRFSEQLEQLDKYTSSEKIPRSLRRKMINYIYHMQSQCKFYERKIQCELSSTLRGEVLIYQNSNLLENSYAFNHLPMHICFKLTAKLVTAVYGPADTIVSAGTIINQMFFIKTGAVALYTQAGREICHLTDGSCFGEIILVETAPKAPTVMTLDWCEVCFLKISDMLEVLETSPELLQEIRTIIRKRMAKTRLNIADYEGYQRYEKTSESDSNISDSEQ